MGFEKLSSYKVLTFDVYGTLIDWESGMLAGLRPLLDRVPCALTLSKDDILAAHARHESTAQRWTPSKKYRALLAVVYRRLAEEWGVHAPWEDCTAYGHSVRHWPAFADSRAALAYLRQQYRLVVLTNTDNQSFAGAAARLGVEFDAVYTAEDIGSYKPDDRNFDYMLTMIERQGIRRDQILHTAESLFHDHVPANKHGLANAWIYRRHNKPGFGATPAPGRMPSYAFRFDSMMDMVRAHQAELAAAG
ncbi:MAG: haloacid dehalogenase type II [Rhodobacteraceae bacterium]|nr:haloacid dehalogenase type II [Paracoccaceae bacterium]